MSSLLQYIHHDTHMNRVSFSRIKPHFCTVHHWYSSSGVPLAPPPCGVPPWKATVHGGDSCGLPLTQTVRLDPAPPHFLVIQFGWQEWEPMASATIILSSEEGQSQGQTDLPEMPREAACLGTAMSCGCRLQRHPQKKYIYIWLHADM